MRRRPCTRGQALVELAIVAPLLIAIAAIPVAAAAWAQRRLDVLEAAREAAWAATAGVAAPAAGLPLRVRIERTSAGLARAEARVPAPAAASPVLAAGPADPRPPGELTARIELDTLPLYAGTEEAGRRAVRSRWLGGIPGSPVRTLLELFIKDEPVRVDFDARPSSGGRP